jgi:tetraacyldisaccharide 4'-kinase
LIELLYRYLTAARRRYFQAHPHRQRRLDAPVVSVGNLSVGGTGKSPVAAEIARMLVKQGEKPAILSRGYGRANPVDGVVVVGDGRGTILPQSDLGMTGDEPMMLARSVPEAAVLVCTDRHLAGKLAETRLGCTVHLLDDGFQHLQLARDVDLLVVPPDELNDGRTLPFGRLREPLEAAALADAVLVPVDSPEDAVADDIARRLRIPYGFGFRRSLGEPGAIPASENRASQWAHDSTRVFAVAGIARPERFFSDLQHAGWRVVGERRFRDHHRFSASDVQTIATRAREAGADVILTTEKDAMRWPPVETDLPVRFVPLRVSMSSSFQAWLEERLAGARSRGVA